MFEGRYERGEILGAGGMGEVLLCRDRALGRQVAIKISKATDAVGRERFIREARIQGQLEHPAIVPVYDFGELPDGRPYFVMKRVRGTSLEEILRRLKEGDPAALQKYTRTKLLGAFVSVCLAIDFAHRRDVIHRDLKPANIMLGDFGEVYVLDWGIVKLVGDAEPGGGMSPSDPDDGSLETTIGAAVGTPAYMAPEQLNGDVEAISIRTDVYALGAILFEILALRSLHSRKRAADDIPPELEKIIDRAVALKIEHRFASVREMADAVERYLEGDRDLAVRAKAAEQHLEEAKRALTRARDPKANEHEERARALSEAACAMALAPKSKEATRTVLRVLLEPFRSLPSEAERDLEEDWIGARRVASKISAFSALVIALFLGAAFWMGVRDWPLLALSFVVTALGGGLGLLGATVRPKGAARYVVLTCWLTFILLLSRVFGPLILVPIVAASAMIPIVLNAYEGSRAVVAVGCSVIAVVFGLELLGVIPSSYVFTDGMMCVVPQAVSFPEGPTMVVLFASQLVAVLILLLQTVRYRERHLLAERRLRLHVWYLKRLVG